MHHGRVTVNIEISVNIYQLCNFLKKQLITRGEFMNLSNIYDGAFFEITVLTFFFFFQKAPF